MFYVNQNLFTSVAVTVVTSLGALLSYFYLTMKPNKKIRRLQGMMNLGNTCFANALLQSLASCPSFVAWFRKLKSYDNLSLVKELNDVISNINSANSKETVSAEGIIQALEKRNWHVTYYTQQDLYELLNVFITTWDEEMTSSTSLLKKSRRVFSLADVHLISNEAQIAPVRGIESLNYLSAILEEQIICRSPCTGLMATQFLCTNCGHKHVRHDKFCALSLSLPKRSFHPCITLEHCLRKYFAVEKLFNVTCDSCKEKSTNPVVGKSSFYKRTGFSKLPSCLIIHLDRVSWLPSGAAFKQDDFVKFDETLDVDDFVFYNTNNSNNKNSYSDPSGNNAKKWQSSMVGGKACSSTQNPYFQQGDVIRSPLAGFCAMANNIGGGLYQYPMIFGPSKPINSRLSAGDIIKRGDDESSRNNTTTNSSIDVAVKNGDVISKNDSVNNDDVIIKNGGVISNSDVINNNDVTSGQSPSFAKYKYQLKAVAAHWGTHDYGHFVAYRRGSSQLDSKNWYFTSDLEVKKVDFEDDVALCQAYMLFYERLSNA